MSSGCYSWISKVLKKIRGGDDYEFFANEDETSIILKKRPLLLHEPPNPQPRRRPLILRYFCPNNLKLYIIDGDTEKECKLRILNSFKDATFLTTCNGLVLVSSTYRHQTRYGVFHPLSNKELTIIQSPNMAGTPQPCAFFLHPRAKEYRILAVGGERHQNLGYEYQIYSFETNNWRPTAKPYLRFRPWISDDSIDCNPAIAKGALHWYAGVIIVFDMMSEELSVKILPFVDDLLKLVYFNGYLITRGDDELCFCVVGRREAAMDVWVLEDYGKWSWCRKWKIDLSWDLSKFPVMEPCVMASYHVVRVVGFQKDEMVLFWRHRGLFVYNLSFRSVDRVWMKRLEKPHSHLYSGFLPYNLGILDQ